MYILQGECHFHLFIRCIINLWKCKTKSFNFGYSGSSQFQASKIVCDSLPTNCCVYMYFLTDLLSVKICCAYGINEGLNQRCIEMLRSDYVHITRWTSFSPVYLDASTLVVIGYYSSCCRRCRIGKKGMAVWVKESEIWCVHRVKQIR